MVSFPSLGMIVAPWRSSLDIFRSATVARPLGSVEVEVEVCGGRAASLLVMEAGGE